MCFKFSFLSLGVGSLIFNNSVVNGSENDRDLHISKQPVNRF